MNKQAVWTLMTVGACLIGLYALASALVPSARGDFVLNMIDTNATGALAHFLGGAVVIIVGALQFHAGLRKNRPALHRCLGRVYVIGVLIGGLAGLYLAFYSNLDFLFQSLLYFDKLLQNHCLLPTNLFLLSHILD